MAVKNVDQFFLFAIIAIATILRFWNLGADSITHDELSALYRLQYDSLHEIISAVGKYDTHPAGVQVFLYGWTGLFGDSVFAIRFPFALAGVLSVMMVFLLGRGLFNKKVGLLAGTCIAVLEYPIIYSQLARPYSFGLLFTLAAAYFLVRHYKQQSKKPIWDMVLFGLTALLACYTHYFALMQVALIGLIALLVLPGKQKVYIIITGISVITLFLPHIGIFLTQLSQKGLDWLGKPGPSFLPEYLWYAFNYSLWFILVLVGVLGWLAFTGKNGSRYTKKRVLLLALFLVPFLVGFCYSVWLKPVLQFSLLIFAFPYLLLFLFSFAEKAPQRLTRIAAIALLVCGAGLTVIANRFYQKHHFSVYKEIAEKINEWDAQCGKENISRLINVSKPFFINYYFEDEKQPIAIGYDVTTKEKLKAFQQALEQCNTPYFMYAWSNGYHPQEIMQLIKAKYPKLVAKEWYFNSEVYLFSRIEGQEGVPVFESVFPTEGWTNTSFDSSVCITDKTEFGPTYIYRIGNWDMAQYDILTLKLTAELPEQFTDATLVLSFESNGKVLEWKSSNFSHFNSQAGENVFYVSHRLPPIAWENMETATVKAYVWNNHKQGFCIKELMFSVENGNPIVYDKYYVPD